MRCEDALERMLETDPASLRGAHEADLELARHIGGCGRCRDMAQTLATELEELDLGLTAASTPRSRRRRRSPMWFPLAAAAVLAAVLVLGGEPEPRIPASQAGAVSEADRPATVAVTLPTDRGAAVMKTTNPKITVVWLYERSE